MEILLIILRLCFRMELCGGRGKVQGMQFAGTDAGKDAVVLELMK